MLETSEKLALSGLIIPLGLPLTMSRVLTSPRPAAGWLTRPARGGGSGTGPSNGPRPGIGEPSALRSPRSPAPAGRRPDACRPSPPLSQHSFTTCRFTVWSATIHFRRRFSSSSYFSQRASSNSKPAVPAAPAVAGGGADPVAAAELYDLAPRLALARSAPR